MPAPSGYEPAASDYECTARIQAVVTRVQGVAPCEKLVFYELIKFNFDQNKNGNKASGPIPVFTSPLWLPVMTPLFVLLDMRHQLLTLLRCEHIMDLCKFGGDKSYHVGHLGLML